MPRISARTSARTCRETMADTLERTLARPSVYALKYALEATIRNTSPRKSQRTLLGAFHGTLEGAFGICGIRREESSGYTHGSGADRAETREQSCGVEKRTANCSIHQQGLGRSQKLE